jgi:inorganic triphosphatase YgiF
METEIKYRMRSPYDLEKILGNELIEDHAMPESVVTRHLRSAYFDTAERYLDKKRAVYRIREEDDGFIATVKISKSVSDGLHQRQEWNVKQETDEPDIEYFLRMAESDGDPDTSLNELLSEIRYMELQEVCAVEFDRTIVHIGYGDTLIELACDTGSYNAGRKSEDFIELELELLEGNVMDLRDFGDELEKVLDIVPENKSKYERSMELVQSDGSAKV